MTFFPIANNATIFYIELFHPLTSRCFSVAMYAKTKRNINSHSPPRSVQAFFARYTMKLTTHVRAWLLAAEFSRKIFCIGWTILRATRTIKLLWSSSDVIRRPLSLLSVDCLSKNISTIKLSHLTSEASGKCYLSTDLFPLVVALGHHISSLLFSPFRKAITH